MVDIQGEIISALMNSLILPAIGLIGWLIAAMVIISVFWFIGKKIVKRIVVQVLENIGVDRWIEEHKISQAIGDKKVSSIAGSLAKWYIILIGLQIAVNIFSFKIATQIGTISVRPMEGLSDLLYIIIMLVPRAIVAILFFVGALLLAKYLANQILAIHHKLRNITALVVEALIVLFAIVIALDIFFGSSISAGERIPQLLNINVGDRLVQLIGIFVSPFIWALAIVVGIAGGLGIGLGFKEEIGKFIKDTKKEYLGK